MQVAYYAVQQWRIGNTGLYLATLFTSESQYACQLWVDSNKLLGVKVNPVYARVEKFRE